MAQLINHLWGHGPTRIRRLTYLSPSALSLPQSSTTMQRSGVPQTDPVFTLKVKAAAQAYVMPCSFG